MASNDENLTALQHSSRRSTYINPYTGQVSSEYVTGGLLSEYHRRVVTKGGLRPKPKGWLFPTPYDFYQQKIVYPHGELVYQPYDYIEKYSGNLWGIIDTDSELRPWGVNVRIQNPFPDVDQQSQAEAKALNKLLTHGGKRDGTFNVGVAWMERKETADLLNSAGRGMLDTITALRNGNVKKAFQDLFPNGSRKDWKKLKGTPYYKWYKENVRNAVRSVPVSPAELSSGYLALSNGWRPALADLNNAAESLAERNSPEHWVITGKGYYKKVVRGIATSPSFTHIRKRYEQEYESTTACFVRVDATVSDPFIHRMTQLGLHGTSAFHAAYEATRLTYVVDYFIAMGDWLQAMGAPAGMEFYSGSVTRYGKITSFLRSVDGNSSFTGSLEQVRWDRKPLDNFPVPIPPLSLKPNPINLQQTLNIVALVESMISGKPVRYDG